MVARLRFERTPIGRLAFPGGNGAIFMLGGAPKAHEVCCYENGRRSFVFVAGATAREERWRWVEVILGMMAWLRFERAPIGRLAFPGGNGAIFMVGGAPKAHEVCYDLQDAQF